MKVYLIRHGATKGNREHRYVGTTDEGLLKEAVNLLVERKKEWQEKNNRAFEACGPVKPDRLYVSPLRRCRETAAALYPGTEQIIAEDLRECDFGDFEYKNYRELNGNADYQRFIDSNGESGFPNGESLRKFQDRCVRAFEEIIKKEAEERSVVMVVHGGTIMAILDKFSRPHRDYYDWQVKNAEGFGMSVFGNKDGFYLGEIKKLWQ